jgi:hypothetical protein
LQIVGYERVYDHSRVWQKIRTSALNHHFNRVLYRSNNETSPREPVSTKDHTAYNRYHIPKRIDNLPKIITVGREYNMFYTGINGVGVSKIKLDF